MKKLSLSLAMFLAISFTPSQSFAEGAFIGVEGSVAYQFIKIDHSLIRETNFVVTNWLQEATLAGYKINKNITDDYSIINGAIGVKGGYEFNKFRIYAQINYNLEAKSKDCEAIISSNVFDNILDIKTKISSTEILAGIDYFVYSTQNFKAFVGGYAGIGVQTIKQDYFSTTRPVPSPRGDKAISETKIDSALILGSKFGGIYAINAHNDIEFGIKVDKPFYSNISTTKIGIFAGYAYKF